MRTILSLLALSTALVVAGCGGSAATKTISGKVTYQNEPVPEGQVIFRDASGQPEVAPVQNGEYTAEVTVGPKTVEITGVKATGGQDALGGPLKQQYLPPQYNEQTTLKIDVAAGGDGKHDFELN